MDDELASTFSIVALDPETGELGIAVESKAFSVGSLVPWAKAGVGAVATQSLVNVSLGPKGLELLEDGLSPGEVIEEFKKIDTRLDLRQVGIVDAQGRSHSYTGENCIPWAGGRTGKGYAIQGNILTGSEVIEEMERAFLNTDGSLARRLVAALQAGQKAGGDARGKQSAALIIEKEGEGRAGYGSRKIELRVEDHPEPIEELSRLLGIIEVNQEIFRIQQSFSKENLSVEEAIAKIKETIVSYDGKKDELWLNLAAFQYSVEDMDGALASIHSCLEENPAMITIIKHFPKLGYFDEEFLKRLD
ncbi:MAG: DUF1028 domain-containing protein [Methanobacteriota archaeon]|nr:MAG: DUF1028 domain-containing protein [Euryarchaeota archaeon]